VYKHFAILSISPLPIGSACPFSIFIIPPAGLFLVKSMKIGVASSANIFSECLIK
jgi:hypothetical protein